MTSSSIVAVPLNDLEAVTIAPPTVNSALLKSFSPSVLPDKFVRSGEVQTFPAPPPAPPAPGV